MNLAIVVHNYEAADGTGGYTVELVTRVARVHEVTLYCANLRTPPPDGVRVVTVPALRGHAYGLIVSFPAAFAAVRGRHDVVHAQGFVAGRADVVTAHVVLGAWRRAVRRFGVRPTASERAVGWLVQRGEAALFRRARLAIAPSEQTRRDLHDLYGRDGPTVVIPHGFRAAGSLLARPAARERLGLPAGRFIALYVGDVRKGLDAALDAIAGCEVDLAVVSRSRRALVDEAIRARRLEGRVHWIGPLDDVSPAYAAADVLLHPSVYDTFGLVVAEAMAHGVPPIVSRGAGVSELITPGASGWLLGDDRAREAREALVALARDPALRGRLAAGARSAALARPWDRVAEETLEAYERVR